jgi:hypothetical protein
MERMRGGDEEEEEEDKGASKKKRRGECWRRNWLRLKGRAEQCLLVGESIRIHRYQLRS